MRRPGDRFLKPEDMLEVAYRHALSDHATSGTPGPQGDPGLSAYQIALLQGFVGNEAAWLLSLVGPTGATGPQGPKGDQGVPGVDGADGANGVGVPVGGTTGQNLVKKSNTDYDTEWVSRYTNGEIDTLLAGKAPFSHTHASIENGTSANNGKLEFLVNGAVLERNVVDSNPLLLIKRVASGANGNLIDFYSQSTKVGAITGGGYFSGAGVHHNSGADYGQVSFNSSDSVYIGRNRVNSKPALVVDNFNLTDSAGRIVEFRSGNTMRVYIDMDGYMGVPRLYNPTSPLNSYIALATTGTLIQRNVADAQPSLKVNQQHASSTGNIVEFQFGGVTKAKFDKNGDLTIGTAQLTAAKLATLVGEIGSVFTGYKNSTTTVANTTDTLIGLDTTLHNTNTSVYSLSGGLVTVLKAGTYTISAMASISSGSADTRMLLIIYINGSPIIYASQNGQVASKISRVMGTVSLALAANDTIGVYLYQDSGASKTCNSGINGNYINVVKVS